MWTYKYFGDVSDRCELISTVTHKEKARRDYVNMMDRNMLYPANNLAKSVDISYSDKRIVEACQVERFVIDEEKRVFWKYSSKTLGYRTAIL